MIQINNPADCCGCTACASICNHDAIKMESDVMGFLYPKIDTDKCVNCGLCEKVCAFNENYDTSMNISQPKVYGARHKNLKEVETSRSGAAFIAFSDWILKHNGVIYGVGYTEHFRVVHKRATTFEERNEFKGSKYVQSDLQGIFRQIKKDLKEGKLVLFSGTPCQTAGLNSYIGKHFRDNLYLIDIVCHGVPSPFIWQDYLRYLEKKQNDKICWFNFRDKQEFGWAAHHETYKFIKDKRKIINRRAIFTELFYKHIMFRHSCGKCYYTNTKRPSDITIADFWHWQKTDSSINADNKGLSLILCNTEKGITLFESTQHELQTIPAILSNCMQGNMRRPSPIHPQRMQFEKDYVERGFEYVIKKYCENKWTLLAKRRIDKLKQLIKHLRK